MFLLILSKHQVLRMKRCEKFGFLSMEFEQFESVFWCAVIKCMCTLKHACDGGSFRRRFMYGDMSR